MHTFIVTAAGLVLLAAVFALAPWPRRRAALLGFIVLWVVVCAVDLGVGVLHAGYGLSEELAVHTVIFGLPVATAWWLLARRREPL